MRMGVNIDHVATLRQARRGTCPDPIHAAQLCERAGATSIVCHLREDRRHIQDHDVRRLRRTLRVPLNLEMSIAPSVVSLALAVRPHQVTLVPEHRQELTTEGGMNVVRLRPRLQPLIRNFQRAGIEVSLFINPAFEQISASFDVGASMVELHTGQYAEGRTRAQRARWHRLLAHAATEAHRQGLHVAAGHGLDYDNVRPIAKIPEIEELNIGFSMMSRALWVGLPQAVKEMRALIA